MAADNSQQTLFYLFIGKEIRIIILISQNGPLAIIMLSGRLSHKGGEQRSNTLLVNMVYL